VAVARGSQRKLSAPIEARRRAPVPAKNSTDREEQLIPWDVDGLKELLNGCRLHSEITVALHSGMRRSEQYVTPDCADGGLMWQHIDFRNDVITLPRSKHGESRHIPMNSTLRKTLEELHKSANSPYVFPVDPPDRWFPEVCGKAKIQGFTWHYLRHTFAS